MYAVVLYLAYMEFSTKYLRGSKLVSNIYEYSFPPFTTERYHSTFLCSSVPYFFSNKCPYNE